jgi:hypothetical protein
MKKLALLFSFLLLSGFSEQPMPEDLGQPSDERAAQDALPQSKDPLWTTLAKTKIVVDEEHYLYKATHAPEVKALVGKEITIQGFIMPLEATETFTHFLLSKRTPTCGFCPPGEPNEVIDIKTLEPVEWVDGLITLRGTFELMSDEQMGMFFKIHNAQQIK